MIMSTGSPLPARSYDRRIPFVAMYGIDRLLDYMTYWSFAGYGAQAGLITDSNAGRERDLSRARYRRAQPDDGCYYGIH
jgi:hypothetical protein